MASAPPTPPPTLPRTVYSVTELTGRIKTLLEERFAMLWVCGEVSNLRRPPSGHAYFTLKDDNAAIAAVMFRGALRQIGFDLEDGLQIMGYGRIGVYAPRGVYQVILEYLEPRGDGALRLAFERLKRRLDAEGLFDRRHKRPLPPLPQRIALVTSPVGAAVKDFTSIAADRFPGLAIDIWPVAVQGERAGRDIVAALAEINRRREADLVVIARGGGSLEDLAAFNDEALARAVFASRIPVVSAVGHETDVTICDFVADRRAATPSAAAEMVVPSREVLRERIQQLTATLTRRMRRRLDQTRRHLAAVTRRIIHPSRRLTDLRLRLDDQDQRMRAALLRNLRQTRRELAWLQQRVSTRQLASRVEKYKLELHIINKKLSYLYDIVFNQHRNRIAAATARLTALDPLAILRRGYSVTRALPSRRILTAAGQTATGERVDVLLAQGRLTCRIVKTEGHWHEL